jgi:Uma2 family endonuclease
VPVLDADAPDERIITHPPLAVFEILSPEDRVLRVMRKLPDYESMGIAGIYLVNPRTGVFQRFEHRDLLTVEECSAGSHSFPMTEIARLVR